MRKSYLALFVLLLVLPLSVFAQNTDLKRLGFKGEVQKVENDGSYISTVYEFDESGNASDFRIFLGETQPVSASITSRTKNSIKGKWFVANQSGSYTLTVSNGKMTKLVAKDDKGTSTITYGYNSKGEMVRSELTYVYYTTETYYEGGYSGLDEYERSLNALANSGSIVSAARNYNRALNAAANVGYGVRERKKKIKHTDKHTETFSDYVYDEFGNWVSRKIARDGSNAGTQHRIITYEPNFFSRHCWEKAKATGDYWVIEAFAQNDRYTDEYRQIAKDYWNAGIVNEVKNAYGNALDSLCRISQSPIITQDNKEVLENDARVMAWDNYVMPERDYAKVAAMTNVTLQGWGIFNNEYQNRIVERSQQLRNDSVAYLNNKARAEYGNAQYAEAINTTVVTLGILPEDATAIELSQDSYYQYILQGLAAATPDVVSTMETYLELYPQGKYQTQVEDERVKYHLAALPGNLSTYSYIRTLPVNDAALAKRVKKETKRAEFKLNRGKLVALGIGVNGEAGKDMFGGFGEIGLRVGYLANWVNLYVGGRFGWMSSMAALIGKDKVKETVNGGHFELLRASVPVQVRLNFAKSYTHAWYLGVGADLNFNLNSKVKMSGFTSETMDTPLTSGKYTFADDKLVNGFTYSPRVSLGVTGKHWNFEVYGLYDLKETFDMDYLQEMHIDNMVHPEIFQNQTDNKMRFGAALRVFF